MLKYLLSWDKLHDRWDEQVITEFDDAELTAGMNDISFSFMFEKEHPTIFSAADGSRSFMYGLYSSDEDPQKTRDKAFALLKEKTIEVLSSIERKAAEKRQKLEGAAK